MTNLYILVLVKTFPIFFIIAVGSIYAYYSKDNLSGIARVTMKVAMPMLAFTAIYSEGFPLNGLIQIFVFSLLLPLLTGAVAWCYLRVTGNSSLRSFYPAVMFMNAGNLCFGVVLLLYGKTALAYAVTLWVLNGLWLFSIGNYILSRKTRLQDILNNPVFIAMILAIAAKLLKIEIWEGLTAGAQWLAAATLPLLLLSLGANLLSTRLTMLGPTIAGTAIRIVAGGLLGYGLIKGLGVAGDAAKVLFITSAMPAAIFSYYLALEHGQQSEFAASVVLMSSLLSILTIPTTVLLADQLF